MYCVVWSEVIIFTFCFFGGEFVFLSYSDIVIYCWQISLIYIDYRCIDVPRYCSFNKNQTLCTVLYHVGPTPSVGQIFFQIFALVGLTRMPLELFPQLLPSAFSTCSVEFEIGCSPASVFPVRLWRCVRFLNMIKVLWPRWSVVSGRALHSLAAELNRRHSRLQATILASHNNKMSRKPANMLHVAWWFTSQVKVHCTHASSVFLKSNVSVLQLTGIILQAAKRLQVNVYVENIPTFR